MTVSAEPRNLWRTTGLKLCPYCKEHKELSAFGVRAGGDRPYSVCRKCAIVYGRKYRSVPGFNENSRWPTLLMREYGLTPEDYYAMLERQGGGCAVCGSKNPGGNKDHFSVDHCHDSMRIRGLLCNHCNHGIGLFKDSLELMAKAMKYLRKSLS